MEQRHTCHLLCCGGKALANGGAKSVGVTGVCYAVWGGRQAWVPGLTGISGQLVDNMETGWLGEDESLSELCVSRREWTRREWGWRERSTGGVRPGAVARSPVAWHPDPTLHARICASSGPSACLAPTLATSAFGRQEDPTHAAICSCLVASGAVSKLAGRDAGHGHLP